MRRSGSLYFPGCMLKSSKIPKLLVFFIKPINLAFLASIVLYSMSDVSDRNNATLRECTDNLSVELAEVSGEEDDVLTRLRCSQVIGIKFAKFPLALRMQTYFNKLQGSQKYDLVIHSKIENEYQASGALLIKLTSFFLPNKQPLAHWMINSTREKADRISGAFPIHVTSQVLQKEQLLAQQDRSDQDKPQQSASDKALTLQQNQTVPDRNRNKGSETESELDMILPIANEVRITSKFGWRRHPIFKKKMQFHSGIDFGGKTGTPVLAVYSGKVEKAGWQNGYGLTVILEHHKGTSQTLYAHLSKTLVKKGQKVQAGDAIGHLGSTGYSTGPHLHFELRKLTNGSWKKIDPTPLIEAAIVHDRQEKQLAWFEEKILSHQKEFYSWFVEFTKQFF